ncbi:ADAMTS-like protein 3, partial [Cricetulus griseus]
ATAEKSPGAYFLPEFALSPQGSFLEDTTGEQFLTYRYDDQGNPYFPLWPLLVT